MKQKINQNKKHLTRKTLKLYISVLLSEGLNLREIQKELYDNGYDIHYNTLKKYRIRIKNNYYSRDDKFREIEELIDLLNKI